MFHVVLVQPEIPPNTGNIIRLCANTGCDLHLVAPLAFALDDARLRRAGLDYHEYASLAVHPNWSALVRVASSSPAQMLAFSTRGQTALADCHIKPGDWLVFGAETMGLPDAVLDHFSTEHRIRVPMRPGSRSLNLSNTVAVVVFEGWRRCHYAGGV